MSYAAPAGNAANFQQIGAAYVAPSYSSVDFSWIPVVVFPGKTTLAMVAIARADTDFSISAGTTLAPEHPYRSFAIGTGSAAAFVTWQRTFDIQTSSTTLFQHGFRTAIASGSSLSVQALAVIQASHAISTGSVPDFKASWIQRVVATVVARTDARFAGAFNRDFGFVVRTKSEFTPAPRFTAKASFAIGPSKTTAEFNARRVLLASFGMATETTIVGRCNAVTPAGFSVTTGAGVAFSGRRALAANFASSSYSTVAFVGAYDYTPIEPLPDEYDVVHVKTVEKRVAAFA